MSTINWSMLAANGDSIEIVRPIDAFEHYTVEDGDELEVAELNYQLIDIIMDFLAFLTMVRLLMVF